MNATIEVQCLQLLNLLLLISLVDKGDQEVHDDDLHKELVEDPETPNYVNHGIGLLYQEGVVGILLDDFKPQRVIRKCHFSHRVQKCLDEIVYGLWHILVLLCPIK